MAAKKPGMKIKKNQALSKSEIVIFGGAGHLSQNKIFPALFLRMQDGQLPQSSRIIVVDNHKYTSKSFSLFTQKSCKKILGNKFFASFWNKFSNQITYIQSDISKLSEYKKIASNINSKSFPVRVFYLAVPSTLFPVICINLKLSGLITKTSRIVLEKPLGSDLESFHDINKEVLECFSEEQIYRIDHYLGKETVQNIMILRFANNLFERIWNSDAIDHIQITVAEKIRVENRAEYYNKYGAMRDMVQNHLLQLLCLIAMEPPSRITADNVRDEKLKVLKALRENPETVLGQYKGYKSDVKDSKSRTETFVAIKCFVDSWRWSNVPFYLRTGKGLKEKCSEIVLQFKTAPHHIFPTVKNDPDPNKLIIRIQPDESVKLQMITKVPGPGGYRLQPVNLNLSLAEEFEGLFPDAYERLLMDVVRGNQTLFMRSDEIEAAWKWTENIIGKWKTKKTTPEIYNTGSLGPTKSLALIEKDGRSWHEN